MRRKVLIYTSYGLAGAALLYGLYRAVLFVWFISMQIAPPISCSQSTMERLFQKQKDVLVDTAEYLGEPEFADFCIWSFEEQDTRTSDDFVVTDEAMIQNIEYLFSQNSNLIIKKKYNGVYFQLWANLDYGRGLVYSLDGEELVNERLAVLEPLADENWYFYGEE